MDPKSGGYSGTPSTATKLTTIERSCLRYVYPQGRRSSPQSAPIRQADEIAESVGQTVEVLARLQRVWRGAPDSRREAIAALAGSENAALGDVAVGIATGWGHWSNDRRAALDVLLQINVGT